MGENIWNGKNRKKKKEEGTKKKKKTGDGPHFNFEISNCWMICKTNIAKLKRRMWGIMGNLKIEKWLGIHGEISVQNFGEFIAQFAHASI